MLGNGVSNRRFKQITTAANMSLLREPTCTGKPPYPNRVPSPDIVSLGEL